MKSFDALSRDEQIQCAEQFGHDILHNYGITDAMVKFWTYSDNVILKVNSPTRVKSPSGHSECETFALRLYNPAYSESFIEATTRWMGALRRDTDVVVPEPIPAHDGNLIVGATLPGIGEPRRCTLFEWLDGEHYDEELTPEHLRLVGEMTAKLHKHAERFTKTEQLDVPAMDWRTTLTHFINGKNLQPAWSDHADAFFSTAYVQILAETAERIVSAIETFDTDKNHGLIHRDLHQWNYMFHDDEVCVMDFEDCRFAHHVCDIAITFWYLTDFDDYHDGFRPMRDAYFGGYQRVLSVPSGFDEQVETFLIARQLTMIDWVIGWPRSDHVFAGARFLNESIRILKNYLGK